MLYVSCHTDGMCWFCPSMSMFSPTLCLCTHLSSHHHHCTSRLLLFATSITLYNIISILLQGYRTILYNTTSRLGSQVELLAHSEPSGAGGLFSKSAVAIDAVQLPKHRRPQVCSFAVIPKSLH